MAPTLSFDTEQIETRLGRTCFKLELATAKGLCSVSQRPGVPSVFAYTNLSFGDSYLEHEKEPFEFTHLIFADLVVFGRGK